jgi:hypothetical protein
MADVGERGRKGTVVAAEPDERLAVAPGDLVDGPGGDAGLRLSVEQEQAACNPVVPCLPGT